MFTDHATIISGENSPVITMVDENDIKAPNHQKKYRKKQANKGFVRYELQIPHEVKNKIEQLVTEIAKEYNAPYDQRRRLALARAQLFTELTADTQHDFTQLKAQISALRKEIAAVAPSFFIKKDSHTIPLPNAIAQLPDNPSDLKQLVAKFHHQYTAADKAMKDYKAQAEQYFKLYNALNDENDRLRKITADFDILPEH